MGEERRSWIDLAVKVAPYIGLSPIKVRWKLENWRRRRVEGARRREQKLDHIRYEHKTCSACGAVQDREGKTCTRCGEPLGRRGFQVLARLGVLSPEWMSMSTLLGLSFVLAFARVLVGSPGGMSELMGLEPMVLYEYGANYPGAISDGEIWRLLTACFLHGGLLHIGFNLFALAVVGPQIESLYGRATMIFLFVLTGFLSNVGSIEAGLATVQIGASGGLMGLVGVAAGWGQRQGTSASRQVRNDMLKWAAYVILFGFFINADNWAHFFGLVAGFVCGYLLRPAPWRARSLARVRFLAGLLGIAAAVAAMVLIAFPPALAAKAARSDSVAGMAAACRLRDSGDIAGAVERAREAIEDYPDGWRVAPSAVDETTVSRICAELAGQ